MKQEQDGIFKRAVRIRKSSRKLRKHDSPNKNFSTWDRRQSKRGFSEIQLKKSREMEHERGK